jgi:hypothetical protein
VLRNWHCDAHGRRASRRGGWCGGGKLARWQGVRAVAGSRLGSNGSYNYFAAHGATAPWRMAPSSCPSLSSAFYPATARAPTQVPSTKQSKSKPVAGMHSRKKTSILLGVMGNNEKTRQKRLTKATLPSFKTTTATATASTCASYTPRADSQSEGGAR